MGDGRTDTLLDSVLGTIGKTPLVELSRITRGLSIVCAVKGYSFVAVMSKGNSAERARMIKALGAEVILIDQLPDSKPGQVSGGVVVLCGVKSLTIEPSPTNLHGGPHGKTSKSVRTRARGGNHLSRRCSPFG